MASFGHAKHWEPKIRDYRVEIRNENRSRGARSGLSAAALLAEQRAANST